jgi:hypothetical protein
MIPGATSFANKAQKGNSICGQFFVTATSAINKTICSKSYSNVQFLSRIHWSNAQIIFAARGGINTDLTLRLDGARPINK